MGWVSLERRICRVWRERRAWLTVVGKVKDLRFMGAAYLVYCLERTHLGFGIKSAIYSDSTQVKSSLLQLSQECIFLVAAKVMDPWQME